MVQGQSPFRKFREKVDRAEVERRVKEEAERYSEKSRSGRAGVGLVFRPTAVQAQEGPPGAPRCQGQGLPRGF